MITLQELEEMERLVLIKGLTSFDDFTNPNYKFLYKAITEKLYTGCILEGSSRSGKTWSGVDIIIWLCTRVETNCKINIYRDTFAEFKDTLYDDFNRRLDDFGLPNKFKNAEIVRSFKIGENKISFIGCDKMGKSHGGGCDYAFFNEMMFIPQGVFDQVEMRCRKFWWCDYNPSFTQHWLFDTVEPRPDIGFLRTTFKDNPFISKNEFRKIMGYEPWLPGSYQVEVDGIYYKGEPVSDKNQPPPHPTNIQNGTADPYMWLVYGLGLRGAMKGVIFPNVTWIEQFPDIAHTYGLDFGFTNDPTVLTKHAEDKHNIWAEPLSYKPMDTPSEINAFLLAIGLNKDDIITADSSDKYTGENKGTVEMVKSLRKEFGWKNLHKVRKTKSVMFWLTSMKEKKIHIVKNHLYKEAKAEQQNYKFKEVNGIAINQPEDSFNHCFSSETLVLTDCGYKKIIDVKKGDFVINSHGRHLVLNSFLSTENARVFDIKISCGIGEYYVSSTIDHKVKLRSEWKEISRLKKGDHIWTFKNSMASLTTFIRESTTFQKEENAFIELYGNFTTEKYRKGFIFIIKMVISTIIALIILSLNTVQNILVNTLKTTAKKTRKLFESILIKYAQKLQHGTVQKRELNGIGKMLKGAVLELKHSAKEIVKYAIQNLKPKTANKNSVLTVANHNIAGRWDLIMNLGSASFVGISLKLINIPRQKPVLRNVQMNTVQESRRQNVYDLTIKDVHEFSANDIIVHNCWDSIRYAHISHNSKPIILKTTQSLSELGI